MNVPTVEDAKRVMNEASNILHVLTTKRYRPHELGSVISYTAAGFAKLLSGDGDDLILYICAMARVIYRTETNEKYRKHVDTPGVYESEITRCHQIMKANSPFPKANTP